MDKKAYIVYANRCIKNIEEIIERYKIVGDMFLPEVVEACFEVSEDMSIEDIIKANKKMIKDSIISLEDFKKLISDQVKFLNDYYSNFIPVDYELVMQSVEVGMCSANDGIDNLEKQALPLKEKIISTINFADGASVNGEYYKETENGKLFIN